MLEKSATRNVQDSIFYFWAGWVGTKDKFCGEVWSRKGHSSIEKLFPPGRRPPEPSLSLFIPPLNGARRPFFRAEAGQSHIPGPIISDIAYSRWYRQSDTRDSWRGSRRSRRSSRRGCSGQPDARPVPCNQALSGAVSP